MTNELKAVQLPVLPQEAAGYRRGCNIDLQDGALLFTADQIRELATAAALAERQRCKRVVGAHVACERSQESLGVLASVAFGIEQGYDPDGPAARAIAG